MTMKIAFIYDAAYPWHVGGVEAVNRNEAVELAKENEVHFFTMQWPGMKPEFNDEGIRYHALRRVNDGGFYRNERRSIMEAAAFSAGLSRIFMHKFDVIITNYFPVLHLPLLYLYCRLTGCRLIMQVVEVWDRKYWKSYLGGFSGTVAAAYASALMHGASFYVANSTATAAKLEAAGIPKEKVGIFSPVLDDRALLRIKARRARRPMVLFSGRFIKEKRIDKWLDVIKKASESVKITAVLIGSGPEEASIKKQIRSMGMGGTVVLRGFYRDRRRLYEQIKSSRALLNMSEREGLSVITIESLALGTPVFLPSYSPIPAEIREMCVVDEEGRLASRIARLIASGEKGQYIRNRKGLQQFRISRVNDFYRKVFAGLR